MTPGDSCRLRPK